MIKPIKEITIKTIWVTKFMSVSDVTSTLSFSFGIKTNIMMSRTGMIIPAIL